MKEHDNLNRSIQGYLGIAQKAGKLACGGRLAGEAIERGTARLLIIAVDAADSVKEDLKKLAVKYGVIWYIWQDKQNLGIYTGKSSRNALAVLDNGFARLISEQLAELH